MEVSSLFPQNRLAFANSSQTTFWQSSSLIFICINGDGGDRGHRCTRHHLLGISCGAGGCVPSSLLPSSGLPAVWLQVCAWVYKSWAHFHPLRIKQDHHFAFQHFNLSHGNNGTVFSLYFRPTVDLIGAMETQSEPSELELDDVVITNPYIEAMLENEDWIEDASYAFSPHSPSQPWYFINKNILVLTLYLYLISLFLSVVLCLTALRF